MAQPPRQKPGLNVATAIAEIDRILGLVPGINALMLASTASLTTGKLYELYVLGILLERLAMRGWVTNFVGTNIVLKGSPGFIKPTDDHFELTHQQHGRRSSIYTDIQVLTLGSRLAAVTDRSEYHEIDIVVVDQGVTHMPSPDQLLLGIECKAVANFSKAFVREVLGRRRELSYFSQYPLFNFDGTTAIHARPPSEYWLAFIDPAGQQYAMSPNVFGVELHLLQP